MSNLPAWPVTWSPLYIFCLPWRFAKENVASRDSLRQKPGGSLPPAVGGCYPPPSSLVVCSTGRVLLPSLTSLSHLHRTCDTISTRALLGGVAKRACFGKSGPPTCSSVCHTHSSYPGGGTKPNTSHLRTCARQTRLIRKLTVMGFLSAL